MDLKIFLMIWFGFSIAVIVALIDKLMSRGGKAKPYVFYRDYEHVFPKWDERAEQIRQREILDDINRKQQMLWYKEYFKK